ncbi:gTP-binding signal recognition particle SRP54 G-domain [Clostridium sp. CAG:411]|jgi:flagellar biosynthesis protein FlhF|nr:flagellar biosynthesis protein FlhF [Lachnospiraceae bacterium]CDE42947.1 gTP-binding signal recognition particle SRP54 G-domain [Clostridium sp. CAG:411]
MVIKKFQAKTEEEAILLAKNELGKNATVMNIKTVKPKGIQKMFRKPSVEITAAVDEEQDYSNGEEMLSKMQEIQRNIQEAQRLEAEKQKEDVSQEDNAMTIENKLDNLQQMLEKQMFTEEKEEEQKQKIEKEEKPVAESKADACIRLVREQLINNEVEENYADLILDEIKNTIKKDTAIDQILASIYQKIVLKLGKTNLIKGAGEQTKYIYFIGPTGVGKTTTIAKIASDLKLHKKVKLALITSDTYRIAAVEQLRTYANILGVPLKVVYSDEEMKKAKEEYADYDVVLIDTAGRSHKNMEQTEDIERLIKAIPEEMRDVYLVLSATTKYKDLVKISETYTKVTKYNLIFTKLDETCCIGNILNVKMLTGAALSYSTSGQTVPDDIEKINPQKIAKQLLGGQ